MGLTTADVPAFETVTVEATRGETHTAPAAIPLVPRTRDALREVVGAMRTNLDTLKQEVKKFDPESLWSIRAVEEYQDSCWGENTWIWNARAWEQASLRLQSCLNEYTKQSRGADEFSWWPRLKKYCAQCVRDMARYKLLCEKGSTRNDATWTAGFRRTFNLQCKLQALKELAEG